MLSVGGIKDDIEENSTGTVSSITNGKAISVNKKKKKKKSKVRRDDIGADKNQPQKLISSCPVDGSLSEGVLKTLPGQPESPEKANQQSSVLSRNGIGENAKVVGKKRKRKRRKNDESTIIADGKLGVSIKRRFKMVKCTNQANGGSLTIPVFATESEGDVVLSNKKKKKKKKRRKSGNETNGKEADEEAHDKGTIGGEGDMSLSNKRKKKKKKRSKKSNNKSNGEEASEEVHNKGTNHADKQLTGIPSLAASAGIDSIPNLANKKKKRKKRKRGNDINIEKAKEEVSGEPDVKRIKIDVQPLGPSTSTDISVTQISNMQEKTNPVSTSIENASAVGKKKKKKRCKRKKSKGGSTGETKRDIGESNLVSVSSNVNDQELEVNDNLHHSKSDTQITKKKKKSKICNKSTESNGNADGLKDGEPTIKVPKNKSGPTNSETLTSVKLNGIYNDQSRKEEITECWSHASSLKKDNDFQLLGEPFRCSYMPDFLQDTHFLEKVKDEVSDIDLLMKNNDLYKFRQTSDLKVVSTPHIASLRKFLYGDFRKWLSDVTGIELNDTVDMGSSRYEYTDVLLCHDDELEGRRIAYILYLAPPWDKEDGGTLDLFDVDENGQPKDVVKSLLPRWNTFAFFEVSPISFHQVQEVLSRDKVRLSINGWFHGSNIVRPPKYVEPPRPLQSPVHIDQDELYSWINPSYLDMDTQRSIRKKFQNDSEIELESFLCDEKYKELNEALQSTHLKWLQNGPANKQSCKVLKQKKLPDIINCCCKLLRSEALFLILSQLTGLKLHHLAPPDSDPDSDEEEEENKNSCPGMILDIRQWSHGCYTLLRDEDLGNRSHALDATLFLHVADEWSLEHGGFTSYVAKDEDEELLTVVPRSNCLALVYRDAESLRFTKYINASVQDLGKQDSYFYDFSCTYKE